MHLKYACEYTKTLIDFKIICLCAREWETSTLWNRKRKYIKVTDLINTKFDPCYCPLLLRSSDWFIQCPWSVHVPESKFVPVLLPCSSDFLIVDRVPYYCWLFQTDSRVLILPDARSCDLWSSSYTVSVISDCFLNSEKRNLAAVPVYYQVST